MSSTLKKTIKASFFNIAFGVILLLQTLPTEAITPTTPPKAVSQDLRFMGSATLRWLGLRVYDGQLWSAIAPKQFDYNRHEAWLELKYARSLKGKDIAKRSIEEIQGVGLLKEDQRQAWLKALVDIFPDVKENDTLGAYHQPGQGIQFYQNGEPLTKLNNPDLAKAFMAIWLDPKTSQPKMRLQMLGLAP